MLDARPREPTMTTSLGLPTSVRPSASAIGKRIAERTRSLEEAFYRFHEDGEAQREQEDAVDESAEHFCPLPSVRILLRRVLPLR